MSNENKKDQSTELGADELSNVSGGATIHVGQIDTIEVKGSLDEAQGFEGGHVKRGQLRD